MLYGSPTSHKSALDPIPGPGGRYKGFEKDPILEPSFPNSTLNLQVYMIIVHVQLKRVKKMGLSKEPTSEVKPIVNKEFLS